MLYDYVAAVFFAAFAILIPTIFLLISKSMRRKGTQNEAKGSPYESGEESKGTSRDVDNEYLPYFMAFLPFEIAAMILILWSVTARSLTHTQDLLYIGIAVFSMVFGFIAYKFINDKHVK